MKHRINFKSHKDDALHKNIRKWLTGQGVNRGSTFFMSKPRSHIVTKQVNFYVDLDDDDIATMLKLAFSEYVRPA